MYFIKYLGIDMIALSFTRRASDIENLRDLMGPRGFIPLILKYNKIYSSNNFNNRSHIKIIAKIEN